MSQRGMKKPLLYLLLAMTFLSQPLLIGAEEIAIGELPQAVETEISPPEKILLGKIDRVGENELVIDDSYYTMSPGSGLRARSFSEGQTVSGVLDEQKRIISLTIERGGANKAVATGQAIPPTGVDTVPSTTGQALFQEDGVWKN